MNGPHDGPDPSALTQPIPVITTVPPEGVVRSQAAEARPQPTLAGPQAAIAVPPAAAATVSVPVPTRYVHRFGSIPTYLLARFAAFAIDIFGVGFILATFGYQATDIGFSFFVAGHDPGGFATLAGGALGIALAFAFLCEAVFGTTLGKLVFMLHTRRGNGRHAGAVRVFVRYMLRPIDLLVIGPLLALVTPRHQRIGDFLGGTVVSRSRIGPFAPVLGLIALVGAVYAQVVLGGGLTSAVGVVAETADYAPGIIARAVAPLAATALLAPHASSTSVPSAIVSTPAPIPSAVVQ